MKINRTIVFVIFGAACLLRFADALRPIDHGSWRECDLGSISRNFVREGMNPLYPRVDWRGTGPGYAEMELPLNPWLMAASYEIFGIHDLIGRLWSLAFSIAALFFFFKLAREYLGPFASTAALAFFSFNPLIFDVSTSIQPEGLMLLTYIAAVYYFVRWLKTETSVDFWLSIVMTALTLLAKAPAAHVGLLFGFLLLEKFGLELFRQAKIWIFGILTLFPAAMWYLHAKDLWNVYGNSLGVSNEYHWIGVDFFTDPAFILGILRTEFFGVWVVFGLLIGLFGIVRGPHEKTARHSLVWIASAFAFYVVSARTTSQEWASYYHVFSVPPVALLFGFGVKKLWAFARGFADTFSQRTFLVNLGYVTLILTLLATIPATLLLEAKQVRTSILNHRVDEPAFVWANEIKQKMSVDGLILASGGNCIDKNGRQLAYNASYMFYWLDRKGWNICIQDQSIEQVRTYAAKGAKYFPSERRMLKEKPGFEDALRTNYGVLSETDEFILFDLTSPR